MVGTCGLKHAEGEVDGAADVDFTAGPWRVDLSGGGVRAALASVGAMYFLGEQGADVVHVTSVSGGSLTNAALMLGNPDLRDKGGRDLFARELTRRLQLNLRAGAEAVAFGGALFVGFLTPHLFAKGLTPFQWKLLSGFAVVWFAALIVARVTWSALTILALVVASTIAVPSAAMAKGVASGVAFLPLVAIVVVGAIRHVWMGKRQEGKPAPAELRSWVPVALAIFAVDVAIVIAIARGWISPPTFFKLGAAAFTAAPIGGRLMRAYVRRVIGDSGVKRARFGAHAWGDASHVFCTTDLRDEGPAFFVRQKSDLSEEQATLFTFLDAQPSLRMTADARKELLASIVQASTQSLPNLLPVFPLRTRRAGGAVCRTFQPMVDGGFSGTLCTQYDEHLFDDSPAGACVAQPTVKEAKRLVVDVTNRRKAFSSWPLLAAPIISTHALRLVTTRVALGSLVDAERDRLDDLSGTYLARVTGVAVAKCHEDCAFEFVGAWRRRAESIRLWWPFGGSARAAVLAGYATAFIATRTPTQANAALLRVRIGELEQALLVRPHHWNGWRLPLGARHSAKPDVAPRGLSKLALRATKEVAPGTGGTLRRQARGWIAANRVTRTLFPGFWLTIGRGTACVGLMCSASVVVHEETADDCRPVCQPAAKRHQFFDAGGELIVVGHEGWRGWPDRPKGVEFQILDDFAEAISEGVMYLETDLTLTGGPTPAVVAAHKRDEGKNRQTAVVDGQRFAAPLLHELLGLGNNSNGPPPHWIFEFNSPSKRLRDAFIETVRLADAANRVCITFGTTLHQGHVQTFRDELRAGLGGDPCTCASTLERLRTGDVVPLRRLIQFVTDRVYRPADAVPCSVVADDTASAHDTTDRELGRNVVLLSWPFLDEDLARTRAIICSGFHGVMVNDPEQARQAIQSLGGTWHIGVVSGLDYLDARPKAGALHRPSQC